MLNNKITVELLALIHIDMSVNTILRKWPIHEVLYEQYSTVKKRFLKYFYLYMEYAGYERKDITKVLKEHYNDN